MVPVAIESEVYRNVGMNQHTDAMEKAMETIVNAEP
jgi:hypothetical protein